MNRTFSRWIAWALTLVLLTGLIPAPARAEEVDAPQPYDFSFAGNLQGGDTDRVCYYTDSYFLRDSREYDIGLATMSLCFELTTFSRWDETGAVWTTEVNETSNARVQNAYDLLTELGFEHFTANDFWGAAPTWDSIGAIAADKVLSDGSTLIALGIRGGNYGPEWASNFTLGLYGEHKGFADSRDHVLSFLKQYIADQAITGRIKLWVVGYSRGGAVANMVAGKLNSGFSLGKATLAPEDLFAYCFAPAVGSLKDQTEQGTHSNIHNVINLNDLVPLLAPDCWDFDRYSTDRWLPSAATNDQFETLKGKMLEFYGEYAYADEDSDGVPDYRIAEYGTQYRLVARWENLFDPEESVFGLAEYDVPTAEILSEAVTFLCEDALGGRTTFYYDYQAGVRNLFALISGGTEEELLADDMDPGEFFIRFLGEMSPKRIVEILSPMTDDSILNIAERYRRTENNLNHAIKDILADSDLWGTAVFAAELPVLLAELLWRALSSVCEDLLVQDTDSLQALINLVTMMEDGGLLQAHLPEVMLSWLMSQDPSYGEEQPDLCATMTRIVRINGAADVEVYRTETGELVAAFAGGMAQQIPGSSIVAYRNSDGEQILMLPPDGDYSLTIRTTDSGTLSYTVDEYHLDTQQNARILWFGELGVDEGDGFAAHVPALSKAELVSHLPNGSDAEYTLRTSGGNLIRPVMERTGNQAKNAVYHVEIYANNTNGSLLGGGTYTLGSYAQVMARAGENAAFQGWYLNGRLVSSAPVYRFPVSEDVNLIARFSGSEIRYHVDYSAGEGGSVRNEDALLPAGTEVKITAVAEAGYAFDHWETDVGYIDTPTKPVAYLVVPNSDVTVRAVFRPEDADHIHQEESVPGIRPTCTVGGISDGIRCAICGRILEEQVALEPLGHEYEDGTCTRCGREELGETSPFTDVDREDYYYESVLWAMERDITAGMTEDQFGPDRSCTRAQIVTFLWRAAGSPEPEDWDNPFVDVAEEDYFFRAVLWAAEQRITVGVTDHYFGPELTCTRGQILTFLWRAAGSPEVERGDEFFTDIQPEDYYYHAALWAAEEGIAVGVDGSRFLPEMTCTRAHAVTFLYRVWG